MKHEFSSSLGVDSLFTSFYMFSILVPNFKGLIIWILIKNIILLIISHQNHFRSNLPNHPL